MKQLDFFIYYRLGLNLYDKLSTPVRAKYGLSYMEFVVLMFLANNTEYTKASDIVEVLDIAKSHVSMTIKELEKKGLLGRRVKEDDRRSSILEIKDKAKNIIHEGRIVQKEYMDAVFRGMDEKDMADFRRIQKKLERNIEESLDE